MSNSPFDQFTGQYSLSKTLRFELVPTEATKEMLEEENVFEKDRIRKEKYEQTKPFFDDLHRDVIKESLQEKTIDGLSEYFRALKDLQDNKKDKKAQKQFNDESKKMRTQVNGFLIQRSYLVSLYLMS